MLIYFGFLEKSLGSEDVHDNFNCLNLSLNNGDVPPCSQYAAGTYSIPAQLSKSQFTPQSGVLLRYPTAGQSSFALTFDKQWAPQVNHLAKLKQFEHPAPLWTQRPIAETRPARIPSMEVSSFINHS